MNDTLVELILGAIRKDFVYFVPRLGRISNVNDEEEKGRVLILIPSLGWNTDDIGAWCYPKDKKSLITPKVNDWVIVEFINGDKNFPVYSGLSLKMKDMLPKNYDGLPTTQLLFEDNLKEFYVKYDEEGKILYLEDFHGNKITLDENGILLEDSNGNTISMESGKVLINSNLEIAQ